MQMMEVCLKNVIELYYYHEHLLFFIYNMYKSAVLLAVVQL